MANEHLNLATSQPLAARLVSAVQGLNQARSRFDELKPIMDSVSLGGDWTAFEVEFGVPGGEGEAVYNIVAGALGVLHEFSISTCIGRLG